VVAAKSMGCESSELRIALQKPSNLSASLIIRKDPHSPTRRDTVGHIREEVPSFEFHEISENCSLKELTVKLCDSIDLYA
jgi:hypothetical protein